MEGEPGMSGRRNSECRSMAEERLLRRGRLGSWEPGCWQQRAGEPRQVCEGGRLWLDLPACLVASTPPRPAASFLPLISGDSSQAGVGQRGRARDIPLDSLLPIPCPEGG